MPLIVSTRLLRTAMSGSAASCSRSGLRASGPSMSMSLIAAVCSGEPGGYSLSASVMPLRSSELANRATALTSRLR